MALFFFAAILLLAALELLKGSTKPSVVSHSIAPLVSVLK
jgi:hypothetical protein